MSEATDNQETKTTGACRKCTTEIPVKADRCPQCGFEPHVGLVGKVLVWIAIVWGATFSVVALSALIVIFDTATLQTGLTGFGIFGFLAMICFGYVANKWETHTQNPAIQPSEDVEGGVSFGEVSNELRESSQEGRERGERWAEQSASRFNRFRDRIPHGVWSISVLIGIGLSLVVWPLILMDYDTAGPFVMVLGAGFLGFSIMFDGLEANRSNDLQFRYYAYVLPAMIPGIGFLFGIVWLLRKRQKLGSVLLGSSLQN